MKTNKEYCFVCEKQASPDWKYIGVGICSAKCKVEYFQKSDIKIKEEKANDIEIQNRIKSRQNKKK